MFKALSTYLSERLCNFAISRIEKRMTPLAIKSDKIIAECKQDICDSAARGSEEIKANLAARGIEMPTFTAEQTAAARKRFTERASMGSLYKDPIRKK